MTPQGIIHIGIIICVCSYFIIYVKGIYNGTVKPVLATWLFFTLAVIISFATDFHHMGFAGISANFFNTVDSIAVITIFIITVFKKDTRKTFTLFEKYCVGVVFAVLVAWLFGSGDIFTHLSVQFILVIAYLPSLIKLWYAKENTEAIGTWIFDCLASILGIIIPIMQMDLLPLVFGIRSVICTALMILFILRLKIKDRKIYAN